MNRFLSGLVIALALTLTAFEWTTVTTAPIFDYSTPYSNDIEEMLPPVTYQMDKVEKIQAKKPTDKFEIVAVLSDPTPDLKDDPTLNKPAVNPLAPIDPGFFGKDHFDNPDGNVPYEKVQVFAHYKKCSGLTGEALQACSQQDIQQRIINNFRTPPQLKAIGGKQGALVSFVVDNVGNITEVTVKQSTSQPMAKAAIEAVESLPKMDFPANQQGKDVALRMSIPIVLNLKP